MGRKLSWVLVTCVLSIAGSARAESQEVLACHAVQQDLEDYFATGGTCPCPYHAASDGHLCGGRSAWAKRKGASPRCFMEDGALQQTATSRRIGPPACGPDIMTPPIPSRTSETRIAAFPSSE